MYHVLFETLSLFILREATPEIFGPWEELEFAAMSSILLIALNFPHLHNKFFLCFFLQNSRVGLVPRHLACASIQIEW